MSSTKVLHTTLTRTFTFPRASLCKFPQLIPQCPIWTLRPQAPLETVCTQSLLFSLPNAAEFESPSVGWRSEREECIDSCLAALCKPPQGLTGTYLNVWTLKHQSLTSPMAWTLWSQTWQRKVRWNRWRWIRDGKHCTSWATLNEVATMSLETTGREMVSIPLSSLCVQLTPHSENPSNRVLAW